MKRANTERILCLLLALCLLAAAGVTAVFASAGPTEDQVYERLIAQKASYPEGMTWTNDNYYEWKGGAGYSGGYGCAAFAFLLSDAAFGSLPARIVKDVDFDDVRVGDILRVNNNSHSVIVLTVGMSSLTVAEGNYNNSVHWGRTLTAAQVEKADYLMTRYPDDPSRPVEAMTDVKRDWTWEGIDYCMQRGLMNGVSGTAFDPGGVTTRGMLMTILARASGVDTNGGPTWYHKGMVWAMANDISDGTEPEAAITREEFVTMLWRYADKPEADPSVLSRFPDASSASSWAGDALAWAVEKGVLNGSDGRLDPLGAATRAQAAAMLMRWHKLTAA